MYDLPVTARERASDSFLTPEALRRKENLASLRAMGVVK